MAKRYESQKETMKRRECCYPPAPTKRALEAYSKSTGVKKSELLTRLLKSFLAERKKLGHDPEVITLLPG